MLQKGSRIRIRSSDNLVAIVDEDSDGGDWDEVFATVAPEHPRAGEELKVFGFAIIKKKK